MRIREVKYVVWKQMFGKVLSVGRTEYFVQFKQACQFVPKEDCELVYGIMKHEP